MITVKTEKDGQLLVIECSGHSEPTGDVERLQVCAGVSCLLTTLYAVVGGVLKNDLDGNGYLKVYVPIKYWHELEFVRTGLKLIDENYPGHLEIKWP